MLQLDSLRALGVACRDSVATFQTSYLVSLRLNFLTFKMGS